MAPEQGPPMGFVTVCGKIFTISKYCGAFPYTVLPGTLRRSYPSLVLAVLLAATAIWVGSCTWDYHSSIFIMANQTVFTRHTLLVPRLALVLLNPLSTGWLCLRLHALRKLLAGLLGVLSATAYHPPLYRPPFFVLSALNAGTVLNGYLHYGDEFFLGPIFAIYHIYFSLAVLFASQFCRLLDTVRGLYAYLAASLQPANAERWTQCHELLGSCCTLLSQCYAPPLVLLFFCMYSLFVVQLFGIVIKIKRNEPGIFYFLYWVLAESYLVWFILFNCRDSIAKATEFDKLLYRMTINDDSKSLLRNKRIQIHFKDKKKVEFSALGLFNFDYPLICSMLSSATTYIVIFVQFTK